MPIHPDKFLNGSEDGVQMSFIQQCRLNIPTYPHLKWLHSIPNGGVYGDNARVRSIRAAKIAATGMVPGVWDLFLPFANCGYHGIYFETKRPPNNKKKGGVLSKEQTEFGEFVWNNGFYCVVYDDYKVAWDTMQHYLEGTL